VLPVYGGIAAPHRSAMVARPLRPLAVLLPDWIRAEGLLSLLLIRAACFATRQAEPRPAGEAEAWPRAVP